MFLSPLIKELIETTIAAQDDMRKDIGAVVYGPPGQLLFTFRGKTYSAPEPKDVLPIGNDYSSKSWALRQLLDETAKIVND